MGRTRSSTSSRGTLLAVTHALAAFIGALLGVAVWEQGGVAGRGGTLSAAGSGDFSSLHPSKVPTTTAGGGGGGGGARRRLRSTTHFPIETSDTPRVIAAAGTISSSVSRSRRGRGRGLLQGWEAEEARLSGLRAAHLEDHPLRRAPVAIPNDKKHVDDTLARMFASVNNRANAVNALADGNDEEPAPVGWRMGRASDQKHAEEAAAAAAAGDGGGSSVAAAEDAALAAQDAKDEKEEKAFLKTEEGEIEREAKAAVDAATDHELHMGHDGRLTNTASIDAMETHKWAAMDSSQLRVELHHIATERNKAAAAVGAIARNCSGELEALFFKFKKKKQARDELREEYEDLRKEKEKLEEEHKGMRDHVSQKVLKHMQDAGIDTEFIKPHHMDVETLLAAATKADNERRQKEMREAIRNKEKLKQAQDMETLLAAGDKKGVSKHVKHYEFKSIPKELYDPNRIKKIAAGKDPDKPSKNEQKKLEKEEEKARKAEEKEAKKHHKGGRR